jgi:hypothetical protein
MTPLFCAALQSNKSPLFNIDIEGITESQQALIDSGSSANFIDPQFACSHNIPLIELDSPQAVIGINGKQVQDSIHFRCCLVFSAQGRRSSAVFYLLPLGNRNLILRTHWLILANPDINWRTLEVLLRPSVEAHASDIAPPTTSIPEEFKVYSRRSLAMTSLQPCQHIAPMTVQSPWRMARTCLMVQSTP